MPDFIWLMCILVAVAVSAVIFWILGSSSQKKKTEEQIGKAEDKARSIIDEALKTAEAKKREALLETLVFLFQRKCLYPYISGIKKAIHIGNNVGVSHCRSRRRLRS